MADKLRAQQQFDQLQSRFVGVGHPDTTRFEWQSHVHRDTYASLVGHAPLVEYYGLALNEPTAKVQTQFIEKMVHPVGAPPSDSQQAQLE